MNTWGIWIALALIALGAAWLAIQGVGRMQRSDYQGGLPPGISPLTLVIIFIAVIGGIIAIVFSDEFDSFEPGIYIPEPPPGWTGPRPLEMPRPW